METTLSTNKPWRWFAYSLFLFIANFAFASYAEAQVSVVSKSLSSSSVSRGQTLTAKVSAKSSVSLSGLIIDLRVVNSSGQMIHRQAATKVSMAAGATIPFQLNYFVSSSHALGTFKVIFAAWSRNWSTTYIYTELGAFSVVSGTTTTTLAPTTTTTLAPTTTTTLPAAPAPGSFSNSGFESGLSGYESWGGNPQAVTGHAHSGSYALEVAGAAGGVGRNIMSLVSVGGSYELQGYARTTNSDEYAELGIHFRSSSGAVLLSRTVRITASSYTLHKIAFTVPSGAVIGQIGVWKNGGTSALYIDDLALVGSSGTTAPPATVTTTSTTTTTMAPLPPSSPTTPIDGLGYPFGSRRTPYVAGIKVTAATQAAQDQAIISLYNKWKGILIQGCGGYYVKFRDPYATVSEGIGYGMLITAVMAGYDPNARTYFDGLFRFARRFPAYNVDPNLMDWRINSNCTSAGDGWNAMDGDLDIAMALLMADRQWGSSGTINYKAEAIKTINAMKAKNFSPNGYSMGGPAPDLSRTSDYMIGHFRAFKRATGDSYWDLAINKSFELMNLMQNTYGSSTGLIPDFIVGLPNNPYPSPGGRIESTTEGYYAWNACRIPWRLGTDYVTSGDDRSRQVTGKILDFLNRVTGGNPYDIRMGYMLNGTPLSEPNSGYTSPTFAGPALAGALVDSRFQNYGNALWNLAVARPAAGYYDYELQLLSMIVASGNWFNPY